MRRCLVILAALIAGGATAFAAATHAAEGSNTQTYRVTIRNLTSSQPLSPPVAATHRNGIHLFEVGETSTDELAAIAQDGNEVPLLDLLQDTKGVTDAKDLAMPLTRAGTTVGMFHDAITFEIEGRSGDRFSIATMLICTNDGFTGLDGVKLPNEGRVAYVSDGYDAGRETNTEQSEDIVDPCSALGPSVLAGDPNGNEDDAVEHDPTPIVHHPGIAGDGDLGAAHEWADPVALVIIETVD